MRTLLRLLLLIALLSGWSDLPRAAADGGLLRLSQQTGPYEVALFTEPTPLRVGPVDFGVLVQDRVTRKPVPLANVTITAELVAPPGTRRRFVALPGAGRIKLLHHAAATLDSSGTWNITVHVEGEAGTGEATCSAVVAEPLPRWTDLWMWIGLPVIPIALFAMQQMLQQRRLTGK